MNEQRTIQASPHFKPETSALVLIDHQVGTMQLIKNLPADVSLRNAVALAKAAKAFGMPIVITSSQEDHVQGPIADVLQRVAPEVFASRIRRIGVVNAWADPAFRQAVLATGRRQLVMAAVTTDICLVSLPSAQSRTVLRCKRCWTPAALPLTSARRPRGVAWSGQASG